MELFQLLTGDYCPITGFPIRKITDHGRKAETVARNEYYQNWYKKNKVKRQEYYQNKKKGCNHITTPPE